MRWKLPAALSVLGAAAVFAARGEWPWQRLEDPVPLAVTLPAFIETQDTLRSGETLGELLARNGVDANPLEMGDVLDARRLRAGLVFSLRRPSDDTLPTEITVRTSDERRVRLRRDTSGWAAVTEPIGWRAETMRIAGAIDYSLYDALDASIPDETLDDGERVRLAWDIADVFQWQVDFSRDIQTGDAFVVVLERMVSDEGDVRFGRILAGELVLSGKRLTAYRFGEEGSRFYDEAGNSLRRAFLRAPVEFRRISSVFNRARRHPILGLVRRHEGIDYAASTGTPVMAAGDGVVLRAGRAGGYGNLVELRHKNGITTRYGHLSRFGPGVRAGTRVGQGDVIGFVGSTGLASGPHLHYEFRVNGVARDPRRIDDSAGEPIAPALRADFDAEQARLAALLAGETSIPPAAVALRAD